MNEELLKSFCIELNKSSKLKGVLYLEGGAALKMFYNVTQLFSGDIDFTFSDETIENSIPAEVESTLRILNLTKIHITKHPNRLEVKTNMINFEVDYYYANKDNCEYYLWKDEKGNKVMLHSLQDLLAEKICCIYSRDKYKDIKDAISIIESNKVEVTTFRLLLNKKLTVKFDMEWNPISFVNTIRSKNIGNGGEISTLVKYIENLM